MDMGPMQVLRRALPLVECSTVTVLKFLITFKQGFHVFLLYWAPLII